MAQEFSRTPTRESEADRLKRVINNLPESVKEAARGLAEVAPALRDFAEGNPHKPFGEVVERIRDALRPSQS